ncbi:hypothetical protein [Aurantibacter sp.]|uniref:hypothetical protein n=1 Tax=Aurantibacter sp. TaxID=2807103 RepID=UPI0035C85C83
MAAFIDIVYILFNLVFKLFLLATVVFYCFKVSKQNNFKLYNILLLFGIHYAFTFFYWYSSKINVADSTKYYLDASEATSWFSLIGISTDFIKFLTYPLVHYLQLDYLAVFLVYSTLSFVGFIKLYKLILSFEYSTTLKILGIPIFPLVLFLPGLHYWTCALGKDSLAFFVVVFFIEHLVNNKSKSGMLLIITVLLLIRPYLVIFMFIAFILNITLFKSNFTFKKGFLVFFSLIIGFISIKVLFNYLNVDMMSYVFDRASKLSRIASRRLEAVGGSYIVPDNYNIFHKMYLYLFTPLFIGAKSIMQIIASFENLFLLILVIKYVFSFSLKFYKKHTHFRFILMYCLIFLIIKAYMLFNIGIAVRQKFMIVPFIIYLLFAQYSYNQIQKQYEG